MKSLIKKAFLKPAMKFITILTFFGLAGSKQTNKKSNNLSKLN